MRMRVSKKEKCTFYIVMIIIKQEQEQKSSCLNPIHNIILINYSLISHGSIVFHKFIIILILHFQILKFQIFPSLSLFLAKKT